ERLTREKALDRNVSMLGRRDSSLNIVALDSLNLLVKNNPRRAWRAYPSVLTFLADRSHRAKDCSTPSADGRPPGAIDRALSFLRNNKRKSPADSIDMSDVEL